MTTRAIEEELPHLEIPEECRSGWGGGWGQERSHTVLSLITFILLAGVFHCLNTERGFEGAQKM